MMVSYYFILPTFQAPAEWFDVWRFPAISPGSVAFAAAGDGQDFEEHGRLVSYLRAIRGCRFCHIDVKNRGDLKYRCLSSPIRTLQLLGWP
jgi:hypothetical protein